MQETQVWSLDQEDSLEKEMGTHSSILAWEIPWTEEPDGLESQSQTWLSDLTRAKTSLENQNLFQICSYLKCVCLCRNWWVGKDDQYIDYLVRWPTKAGKAQSSTRCFMGLREGFKAQGQAGVRILQVSSEEDCLFLPKIQMLDKLVIWSLRETIVEVEGRLILQFSHFV